MTPCVSLVEAPGDVCGIGTCAAGKAASAFVLWSVGGLAASTVALFMGIGWLSSEMNWVPAIEWGKLFQHQQ